MHLEVVQTNEQASVASRSRPSHRRERRMMIAPVSLSPNGLAWRKNHLFTSIFCTSVYLIPPGFSSPPIALDLFLRNHWGDAAIAIIHLIGVFAHRVDCARQTWTGVKSSFYHNLRHCASRTFACPILFSICIDPKSLALKALPTEEETQVRRCRSWLVAIDSSPPSTPLMAYVIWQLDQGRT